MLEMDKVRAGLASLIINTLYIIHNTLYNTLYNTAGLTPQFVEEELEVEEAMRRPGFPNCHVFWRWSTSESARVADVCRA